MSTEKLENLFFLIKKLSPIHTPLHNETTVKRLYSFEVSLSISIVY